jgi:hypothetical protein
MPPLASRRDDLAGHQSGPRTSVQNPAMQVFAGCPGSGAQQSAEDKQRSSRFAHIIIFGEHMPTGSTNSAALSM